MQKGADANNQKAQTKVYINIKGACNEKYWNYKNKVQ